MRSKCGKSAVLTAELLLFSHYHQPILPGQCPDIPVYQLYAPPGCDCCSGLRELLPGGKNWALRVRPVGGNASDPIAFSTPEKGRLATNSLDSFWFSNTLSVADSELT